MNGSEAPWVGCDLAPSYFFSYSRSDTCLVNDLKSEIGNFARGIWHDIDQIAVGDDWKSEIINGIQNSDDLILFLSNASAQSNVVRFEVEFASSIGRNVKTILIEPLRINPPEFINRYHYLDISNFSNSKNTLFKFLNPVDVRVPKEETIFTPSQIKGNCSRGIWPAVTTSLFDLSRQQLLTAVKSVVSRAAQTHSASSPLRLNSGLVDCMLGNWEEGLSSLSVYANAANNFTGWYLYALHINQLRPIHSIDVPTGKAAQFAIAKACSFGLNPLAKIVQLAYEYGFDNRSIGLVQNDLASIEHAQIIRQENSSEFIRAYWSLKSSLRTFGHGEAALANFMKRNAIRGK